MKSLVTESLLTLLGLIFCQRRPKNNTLVTVLQLSFMEWSNLYIDFLVAYKAKLWETGKTCKATEHGQLYQMPGVFNGKTADACATQCANLPEKAKVFSFAKNEDFGGYDCSCFQNTEGGTCTLVTELMNYETKEMEPVDPTMTLYQAEAVKGKT